MAGGTQVGKLAVVLTAESKEFDFTVDRAQSKLKNFGHGAGGKLGESGGGLSSIMEHLGPAGEMLTKLGSFALNPATMGIAATTGALAGLFEITTHVGHEFHETTKRAEILGISTTAMAGLTIAAKDKADDMQVAMKHLERTIGEAAGGSTAAQAKFSSLGVSWQELEAMSPEAAFGKLNDKIKESGSVYEKAAAARAFYGRAGQENMRLIEQGSAGIDAAMARARDKGLVPDEEFTKNYEQYLAAKRDVMQTLTGFKNKIAINVGGPILEGASLWMKTFSAMMEGYDYAGTRVKQQAAEMASTRAADTANAIAGAKAAAQQRELEAASQLLVTVKKTNEELEKQIKAHGEVGTEMELQNAMEKEREARKQGGTSLDLLREMSGDLPGGNAAADMWHETAMELRDKIGKENAIRRMKELAATAKSVATEMESPLEKSQQKFADIESLFSDGRISAEQFGRASVKALEETEKAAGGATGPLNALTRGSQADRSFGLAADREAARNKLSFEERRAAAESALIGALDRNSKIVAEQTRKAEERRQYTEEMEGPENQ